MYPSETEDPQDQGTRSEVGLRGSIHRVQDLEKGVFHAHTQIAPLFVVDIPPIDAHYIIDSLQDHRSILKTMNL